MTKEIISEIIDIVKDKIINGTGSKAYQSYKLDSNEKWGMYLYFSSDKKRQEYIDSYNENK